jgi:hypothetical protein
MANEEEVIPGKGRVAALEAKMAPPEEDAGQEGLLADLIETLRSEVLPQADEQKAQKIQQAIDILDACLDAEEAPEAGVTPAPEGTPTGEAITGGFPGV